jgi:iron complex outermembrane receptor protein
MESNYYKIGLAGILFFVFSFEMNGQKAAYLNGIVCDSETGDVLKNVVVKSKNREYSASTDEGGRFSILVSKEGKYALEFSHIGYMKKELSIPTGEEQVVFLKKKGVDLSEVVVTERKRISPLQDLTVEPLAWKSSITLIQSDDIQKMGAVTSFDALKYSTNGLPATQGRRKKHFYLLRGQQAASDYAVNGVSLSTNGDGPMAQWVEAPAYLPANMIESIEVVRSGNSLLLGFSGSNGVVNIKTRTFDTFETQAETEYGTFNTVRAGLLHGGAVGNFNYAVSLYRNRTDGPKGRHSFEDFWNLYAKIGYKYKKMIEFNAESFYTYGTRYVTQAQDYEGLAAPEHQLAEIWEYDPMRYNINIARLKINEGVAASTELQLSYILNRMDLYPDEYEFKSIGGAAVGDSIIRSKVMVSEPDSIFSFGLFQALSPFRQNFARVALMYASSTNYTHGKSKKKIVTASLLDQHTFFDKLDVHAGVKFIREYYDYYVPNQGSGSDFMAVKNEWQPILFNISGGLSYRKNNFTLNAMMNSGKLPVDRSALRRVQNQITGYYDIIPLKQENRTSIDLGAEYSQPSLGNAVFTLFFLRQNNTVEFTNVPYYDEDQLIRYYMDNVDLQTWGFELTFQSALFDSGLSYWWNMSYKYLLQNKDNGSEYKKYAKQPSFIANGGISYFWGRSHINFMGKYVSSYKTDRFLKQEVDIGNYFNFDMTATYNLPKYPLQLYGSVVNITDKRYATVSPLYPDFGRQFKIGLRFIWGGGKIQNNEIACPFHPMKH